MAQIGIFDWGFWPFGITPTFQSLSLAGGPFNFTPIAPPAQPVIGSITAGGLVDNGDHYYLITYVTATGETRFGPSSLVATTGAGNNTVNLTGISVSVDPRVIARRIYRGTYATPYYKLLDIIPNNIATTYSDIIAEAALPILGSQQRWDTTAGLINVGGVLSGYVGPGNTALGLGSLTAITSGFDNTAIGQGTLAAVTSGFNLTALGTFALYTNTVGSQNTGIGVHALQMNLSGSLNTAIGVSSMQLNSTGDNNTAIGYRALASAVADVGNTCVGMYCMQVANGGNYNTGVGLNSLALLTTGDYNAALGYCSGYSITTGTNNIAIGSEALYSMMGGWNNTAVGFGAFRTLAGGNAGVAIGAFAGYYETAAAKLFIDNDLRASEADARVKALIYGQFAATTAAQYLWINGRFGVLLAEVQAAANNAAAAGLGVLVGQFYRTNADPSILCIRSA